MAQITVLQPGTTQASSTDVVVASGDLVTIGLFAEADAVPSGVQLGIAIDTPGKDIVIANLSASSPVVLVQGPGTFRALRGDINKYGVAVGAFIENA